MAAHTQHNSAAGTKPAVKLNQKHPTSHPAAMRTPLTLLKSNDTSELPDSARFIKAHVYFKQIDVSRGTSTGFTSYYTC